MSLKTAHRGLFVTGTDTGVGKTVIAAALVAAFRERGIAAGVMKPVATGCFRDPRGLVSPDAVTLAEAAGLPTDAATLVRINPVRYALPVAPLVAAAEEERPLDHGLIQSAIMERALSCDFLVVEGIGGALTPLSAGLSVLDLAREIGYPILVVARSRLGALNHSMLTVEAIRRRGLPLAGLVLNDPGDVAKDGSERTNLRALSDLVGPGLMVQFPHQAAWRERSGWVKLLARAAQEHLDLTRYLEPGGNL